MDGASGTPGPATTGGVRIAPVVLKTLITVVVSTVAYVITNLVNQSGDDLWKLAVSIVIGGSALIVQYLVDFEQRLTAMETGQRRRTEELHEHFVHLSEAAGLLSELDQAGMSTSDVRRLIRSATRVGAHGPEIAKAFARAEIDSLASVVTELTGMTAHWPRDNNEWLLRLTACARRTIDATSSSVDRPFWDTDPAGDYLYAQTEAMRVSGVSVRRLFMLEAGKEDDEEFMGRFLQLCKEQSDLGIKVRYTVLTRNRHHRAAVRDVVIFDRELYLEFEPDRMDGKLQTRLDAGRSRVQERVSRFDELWETAVEPELEPEPRPVPPSQRRGRP
ncbi:hypothetical protein U5640_30540 [Streptomyces sp. SS7]|uniref:hypothetical protein n=1 Tax=Streptomyces sp. SS7 TaxID=3108485 RepID=UPI0030EE6D20